MIYIKIGVIQLVQREIQTLVKNFRKYQISRLFLLNMEEVTPSKTRKVHKNLQKKLLYKT